MKTVTYEKSITNRVKRKSEIKRGEEILFGDLRAKVELIQADPHWAYGCRLTTEGGSGTSDR